jgi:hypothetical protein
MEVALLFDVDTRRAWLVPKLSLLLHMAHAYARYYGETENDTFTSRWGEDSNESDTDSEEFLDAREAFSDAEDNFSDPIPFAKPHASGIDVRRTLEDSGRVEVSGRGTDALLLSKLFFDFSVTLLSAFPNGKKSSGKHLHGFEFMDIVTQPIGQAVMKRITIEGAEAWLDLANNVHAVIVCANIGEVMGQYRVIHA